MPSPGISTGNAIPEADKLEFIGEAFVLILSRQEKYQKNAA